MMLYYTIKCYTTDNIQIMPLSLEASTSIKVPSSLASYSSLSVISRASKGFSRQHTYDKNTRWASRVQETEKHWIGTKT